MKEKPKIKKANTVLLNLAEGIFSHAIDCSLWLVVYGAELMTPRFTNQVWKAQIAADRFLNEVNYEVIKNALKEARRRGFVKKSHRRAPLKITVAGKRRLQQVVPQYNEKRVWDGRIHLVTYDVPEKHHSKRDLLRMFLVRLGCAKLQESVWLTPYNPLDTLHQFVNGHHLSGTVIVSDLGTNGTIGEESIIDLLVKIYKLESLNDRYLKWLKDANKRIDHWLALKYLAILHDDPQLPFSLLPSWWKGDEAYQKIKKLFAEIK